ncbi:hypothetical protein GQ43DRAFT_468360 [Delitschia confertaspora ATCC 74209]|uniref:Zn(2)-C6 fungal-type domain-containing protein n=1 Tax=Delitschia confertaspora ATCC 74209 TaxID=1513339 RepID=A0A9P4JTB3_9PLEO|nr:hypothetical protein GQ43DRAFT_468360 [Delitschia confertaspora ATCC 74209]
MAPNLDTYGSLEDDALISTENLFDERLPSDDFILDVDEEQLLATELSTPFTSSSVDTGSDGVINVGSSGLVPRNACNRSVWGGTPTVDASHNTKQHAIHHTSSGVRTHPDNATNTSDRKRRGHTKSRLGCVNCKRRKIKCQETWPQCANCVKRAVSCHYPTAFNQTQHARIVSELLSSPRNLVQLPSTPTQYTANDMRLFHHFLVAAHPCVPRAFEPVWVKDVPTFSHHYDYLMHAILALSGSHIAQLGDDSQTDIALSYRQSAIKGLNKAFSKWPLPAAEAHVTLATSFLLAYQSGYMSDGFIDHMLSLRGCNLLTVTIRAQGLDGVFTAERNLHDLSLELRLQNFPIMDQGLLRDALSSLYAVAPLLTAGTTASIEKTMYNNLVDSIRPLILSPTSLHPSSDSDILIPFGILPEVASLLSPSPGADSPSTSASASASVLQIQTHDPIIAYQALHSSFAILLTCPLPQFQAFFSPSNRLAQILMSHYAAIRFIHTPLSAPEAAMNVPVKGMVEWCETIIGLVKDDQMREWTRYVKWPAMIVKGMRKCLDGKRGVTLGDLYEALVRDPRGFGGGGE